MTLIYFISIFISFYFVNKRLNEIQKEVETLQKNYWEMISENEADD